MEKIVFSKQRRWISWGFLLFILLTFWVLSRYPDLLKEYYRSNNNTLLDRNVGAMSKDEMLISHGLQSNFSRITTTTINWLDTNKKGMSFGVLFAAAILLLLQQSQFLYRQAAKGGGKGIFSGLLLGMPLGVCTNCATPVSLGLRKAGASNETAFTALIASPSLNPIGLLIIFILFPPIIGYFRVAVIGGFLLLVLPLIVRFIEWKYQLIKPSSEHRTFSEIDEGFKEAFKHCLKTYWHYLSYILLSFLPLMVIIGLISAILITYFPLEKFLLLQSESITAIIFAGIFGALLPMPMFVDIVVVWMLTLFGLPLSLSVTLMLTLAPTSLLAMYIMGRYVSWRLSITVTTFLAVLGILSGLWVYYFYQPQTLHAINAIIEKVPNHKVFTEVKLPPLKSIDYKDDLYDFFAAGISLIDYNNDGLVDIFIPGKKNNVLFKNLGNGKFKNVSKQSAISNQYHSVAGIWGDYNNDGLPDLYLVNYQNEKGEAEPNILYKNNGDGTFTDVSKQVGLTDKDYSSSATWGDYDNDGYLDLFVSNYGHIKIVGGKHIHGSSQKDRLYKNIDGHFVDVSETAGVAGKVVDSPLIREVENKQIAGDRGFSFQAIWFDYNNDGLIDLFVAADFGTSQLYKNKGDGSFQNVTNQAGLAFFGTGMGVEAIDINHDGYFDLYVTTTIGNKLWLNKGDGSFYNAAAKAGVDDRYRIGWGIVPIDYHNEGKINLLLVNGVIRGNKANTNSYEGTMTKVINSNVFFAEMKPMQYKPLPREFNLVNDSIGRGAAMADFDNNGHMDMAISNRDGKRVVLYKNNDLANHYLKLKLIGTKSNRMAVGAKVSVYVQGLKVQHKLLTAGSSFLSQHSDILHFGLGKTNKVDKLIIHWPSGIIQELKNIKANQTLTIKESQSAMPD